MTNPVRLIAEPTVIPVAWSKMDRYAMSEWAAQNDLGDVLLDKETPLGKIWDQVREEGQTGVAELSSVDLLPEFAGRFCYASWRKGRDTAAYYDNIRSEGHGSILEHSTITLAISGVSRALTHELVRHRAGFAISQESQRYVNANNIKFVVPPLLQYYVNGNMDCAEIEDWLQAQMNALTAYEADQALYQSLMESDGYKARTRKKRANEAARANLPNACETKLIWTGNFRALRHFLATRGGAGADLEIRQLALSILRVCEGIAPENFFDIEEVDPVEGDFGIGTIVSSNPKV